MSTPLIVALGVVVLAIVAVAIWLISRQQRRRAELREHFGPEYRRGRCACAAPSTMPSASWKSAASECTNFTCGR